MAQDFSNYINTYKGSSVLQQQFPNMNDYLALFGYNQGTTPSSATTSTTSSTPLPSTTTTGPVNIIGQDLRSDGYNPYAPNPNVNTNYRPNYDFRQFSEYGINPSTMDRKQMDMNQEFFYGKPPTGLEQLANKAINFVPYIGPIKRGVEFLTGAIGDVMPINKRAILENELRGSGVYTDDIGRIAIGPDGKYNTPEGIMAGYNASQMTDKTFDKRTGNITNSLMDRASTAGLNISAADLQAIVDEIAETGKYSGSLTDEDFGVKNLFSNLINVNMAKFNFKNQKKKTQDIIDFQNKERDRKKREKAAAALEKARQEALTNPKSIYGSGSNYRSVDSSGNPVTSQSAPGTTQFDSKTGKGRRDFNDGGRVYLYNRLK